MLLATMSVGAVALWWSRMMYHHSGNRLHVLQISFILVLSFFSVFLYVIGVLN